MKHLSMLFFFNSSILQNRKRLLAFLLGLISVVVFGFYYMVENNDPTSAPISNKHYRNKDRVMFQEQEVIGNWSEVSVMPDFVGFGSGQSGVGYFRNDTGWVYSVGSANPANSPAVYRYNVNTNTWATMAPLPSGRDRLSCAVLKDSIYAVAGTSDLITNTNTLFKYDVKTNVWVIRADLPVSISWTGSVGYQDSLVYVAGGAAKTFVNTVYLYNAISNTWRNATPLPAVRLGGGFSKSGDTLVYAGGLDDISFTQNTTYKGVISQVDRSVIIWTTGAPMPLPLYRTAATEWGNKGIILTNGSISMVFTGENVCYVYSPGANIWTTQANKTNSTTYSHIGSVRLANNIWKLVCAGGYDGVAYINNTEVFTDTLSGVVGIDPANSVIPNAYALSQNYPNPFNPVTKISYDLPKSGLVKVVVYDIMGKEVKTLVNENKQEGKYIIDFNASGIVSGAYFYRFESGGFSATKAMLLIK